VDATRRSELSRSGGLLAALTVVAAACGSGSATVGTKTSSSVNADVLVVGTKDGHLIEVGSSGGAIRTIAKLTDRIGGVEQLDLSADRRTVFAAVGTTGSCRDEVVRVDVSDGSTKRIGFGSSVALSPDGQRLASFYRGDCTQDSEPGTAIVVRDLSGGHELSFPVSPLSSGVGGSFVLSWSPDGRDIAFDGVNGVRLLDTTDPNGGADARLVMAPQRRPAVPPPAAQPGVVQAPGIPAGAVTDLHAGIFLDARTIVGLIDCCIGPQRLVAIDLTTGAQRPFLDVDAPTQGLHLDRSTGRLAFVTALQEAWVAQGGSSTRVWSPATAIAG
jgi:hypothetical protein